MLLAEAVVHERGSESLGSELAHPGRECVVGECSLPAEIVKARVELLPADLT